MDVEISVNIVRDRLMKSSVSDKLCYGTEMTISYSFYVERIHGWTAFIRILKERNSTRRGFQVRGYEIN